MHSRGSIVIGLACTTLACLDVHAQTITGSLSAAPSGPVLLNQSDSFAFYGDGIADDVQTDDSNIAGFTQFNEGDGHGSPSSQSSPGVGSAILSTYSNQTSSAVASSGFSENASALEFQSTLFAPTETFSIYLSNYQTAFDFTATDLSGGHPGGGHPGGGHPGGGGGFVLTDLALPTSSDGDGTGQNDSYGVLTLTVTGAIGDIIDFEDDADGGGVTANGLDATPFVGINAVSVDAPEPSATGLLVATLAILLFNRCGYLKAKSVH
jgi:hypothetical protein